LDALWQSAFQHHAKRLFVTKRFEERDRDLFRYAIRPDEERTDFVLHERVVPQVVRDTIQPVEWHGAFGLDAELHDGLAFSAAVSGIDPFDLQVLTFNASGMLGLLNTQGAIYPSSQVCNVEAIDALALDGNRRGFEDAAIASRVKTGNYRNAYDGQARQYDPVPGMKKRKDAERCPDYCCQGGEGLKGELHAGRASRHRPMPARL
jgi:hypothetical protein